MYIYIYIYIYIYMNKYFILLNEKWLELGTIKLGKSVKKWSRINRYFILYK